MRNRIVVAGAGIVGLATAAELTRRGHQVTVIDKEARIAAHQTGHNSGVIHSGLYYQPGSLKASMSTAGAASMTAFAREFGVPHNICGKLVVATRPNQLGALHELHRRGEANGVPCRLLTPEEALEFEPHVASVAALRVETTGVIDYPAVCTALRSIVESGGGEIVLNAKITEIRASDAGVVVVTEAGEFPSVGFVNCAGLHSDRLARMAGLRPDLRIVPFRGEYFDVRAEEADLIKGLIYPVPDPDFPFLGVHFTRMLDGTVHAGPNAIFSLAREGYSWRRIDARDVMESAQWPGLWRLGARFWRTGLDELLRSLSRKRVLETLRELVPELSDQSISRTHAGVRAQALRRDGRLVDDFAFATARRQVHVLNAPSPAATASLEIAKRVADEVESQVL